MEDKVKKILSFINEQPQIKQNEQQIKEETQQTKEETHEHIKNMTNEMSEESDQNEKEQKININNDNDFYKDTKKYNKMLRDIKKIKNYPSILSINDNNRIFNNENELNEFKKTIMKNRREYNKEQRKTKIDNTQLNLDKLPEIEDDEELINDDNIYYKRGRIEAVKHNDKIKKIPSTNKKDRKKIYNNIKDNKEVMTNLTKSKDDEEFNEIMKNAINNNEVKEIYEQHKQNDINKDNTWTRNEFYKYMLNMIEASEPQQTQQQKQIKQKHKNVMSYGLNPALLHN